MGVATRTIAKKGTRAAKVRKKSPTWWKWTKRCFFLGGTLFFIGGIAFAYMFGEELKVAGAKVANLDDLLLEVERPPSQIYSADGKLLYQVSAEYRKPIRYEKIPENVKNAILAAEDKRFFSHPGVDVKALGRILFTNVKEQRAAQGGSTLTMQLAKLLYTNSEKSFKRKLGDMAMAYTIEKKLTKEQILELYVNKVFFGGGAHGIAAAADVYFNKPVDKLTVGEAALLARCVRRPSDENPFRNLDKAMDNRNIVLRTMLAEGMITQEEYDEAKAEKYKFKQHANGVAEKFVRSEYFVWHVLESLKKEFPDISLSRGGYKIYTTLDTTLQSLAEAAVKETVDNYRRQGVTTAAFVAMDRDGRVLCEVGGLDFKKNQFNVVTDGYRQPGSSFKPFIYSAALSTGVLGINDSISNEKLVWPMPGAAKPWTPKNSNGKYGGHPSVSTAFKMSMNVPMARVMQRTGPEVALAYARDKFGFRSPDLLPVPALCLGSGEVTPLEMASAYSTFMLRGNRVEPYVITRMIEPDGTVHVFQPKVNRNVLDERVADEMDALMRLVVTSGTGTRAGVVPNARGKTGTTSDNKDAWFCGYADGVVGIGWIANEVPREGRSPIYQPMARSIFGGTVTIQFWTKVMKYAQQRFGKEIERPSMSSIMRDGGRTNQDDDPVPNDVPDDTPPDTDPVEPPILEPQDLPGQPATNPGTGTTGNPGANPPGTTPPPGPGTQPPGTDPPPVKPPTRNTDPPRDERLEEVEICADTGMRSSIYCPETVTRRFARGQEPRRRCTTHGGEHR